MWAAGSAAGFACRSRGCTGAYRRQGRSSKQSSTHRHQLFLCAESCIHERWQRQRETVACGHFSRYVLGRLGGWFVRSRRYLPDCVATAVLAAYAWPQAPLNTPRTEQHHPPQRQGGESLTSAPSPARLLSPQMVAKAPSFRSPAKPPEAERSSYRAYLKRFHHLLPDVGVDPQAPQRLVELSPRRCSHQVDLGRVPGRERCERTRDPNVATEAMAPSRHEGRGGTGLNKDVGPWEEGGGAFRML